MGVAADVLVSSSPFFFIHLIINRTSTHLNNTHSPLVNVYIILNFQDSQRVQIVTKPFLLRSRQVRPPGRDRCCRESAFWAAGTPGRGSPGPGESRGFPRTNGEDEKQFAKYFLSPKQRESGELCTGSVCHFSSYILDPHKSH